jgi:predicted HicB family RNase H-like nuclease
VIGFHADNVQDLRDAFGAAVDDYLATCEKLNRPAQKPASGKLMLRVPPRSARRGFGGSAGERHEFEPMGELGFA